MAGNGRTDGAGLPRGERASRRRHLAKQAMGVGALLLLAPALLTLFLALLGDTEPTSFTRALVGVLVFLGILALLGGGWMLIANWRPTLAERDK